LGKAKEQRQAEVDGCGQRREEEDWRGAEKRMRAVQHARTPPQKPNASLKSFDGARCFSRQRAQPSAFPPGAAAAEQATKLWPLPVSFGPAKSTLKPLGKAGQAGENNSNRLVKISSDRHFASNEMHAEPPTRRACRRSCTGTFPRSVIRVRSRTRPQGFVAGGARSGRRERAAFPRRRPTTSSQSLHHSPP
jgi:hypothetical protein